MLINNARNFTNNRLSFNANFNTLEQQAIEAVCAYSQKHGLETAQIIKKGVNITDKFTLLETPNEISISLPTKVEEIFNKSGLSKFKAILDTIKSIVNFRKLLKNSIYIHSHTTEMPLSPADIYLGIRFGFEKMVAVTPSGKTSVLENFSNKAKMKKGMSAFNELITMGFHLRETYGNNYLQVQEAFKIAQKGQIDAINQFVEITGAKYSSDI